MSFKVLIPILALLVIAGGVFLYRTQEAQPVPEVSFGGVSLRLEYATTTEARERGLSGREGLAEDEALLFVFDTADRYGFWMKDMKFSIDIFWLDDKGQVVFMKENAKPESYPDVFYPDVPATYVLETRAGFGESHAIERGALLELPNRTDVLK